MLSDLNDFCRLFHQDFEIYGTTGEEIIHRILKMIGPIKAAGLNNFLGELLSSDVNDGDLAAIWEQSPADIRFTHDDAYRPFLEIIRDMAGRYARG